MIFVQLFTHVYLYTQTAVDTYDLIYTRRIMVILITGKPKYSQLEPHAGTNCVDTWHLPSISVEGTHYFMPRAQMALKTLAYSGPCLEVILKYLSILS